MRIWVMTRNCHNQREQSHVQVIVAYIVLIVSAAIRARVYLNMINICHCTVDAQIWQKEEIIFGNVSVKADANFVGTCVVR